MRARGRSCTPRIVTRARLAVIVSTFPHRVGGYMRVVQIAPPWFPVPPSGYGGIERVVYDLTEGLLAARCEVILCAPAGSQSNARLVPTVPRPVGLNLTEAQKARPFADASRLAYRAALDL